MLKIIIDKFVHIFHWTSSLGVGWLHYQPVLLFQPKLDLQFNLYFIKVPTRYSRCLFPSLTHSMSNSSSDA